MMLTERESEILSVAVVDHIKTGHPVASSRVKEVYRFPMSPATIRNTMAALEREGYLMHPHTSAGKIPTDQGYRTYVDDLMVVGALNTLVRSRILKRLEEISGNVDSLLRVMANLVARLSGCMGIVISSRYLQSVLNRIQLVPVTHNRIIFVVDLDNGDVRTLMVELKHVMDDHQRQIVEEILNERLAGLTLDEIAVSVEPRLQGTIVDDWGITTVIIKNSKHLFPESKSGEVYTYGMRRVLSAQEFKNSESVYTLVSLFEDEWKLRDLIAEKAPYYNITATIGREHEDDEMEIFSTIKRSYIHEGAKGTLAVLAPKRVDYAHVFAVLEFLAGTLSSDE